MDVADTILSLYKRDERAAFQLLFDTYYETLTLFANRIVDDPETAEDVVQECFVDFWANRRFESLSDGLDRYVFQAVKHAALSEIRSRQRRKNRHEQESRERVAPQEVHEEEEWDKMEVLYATVNQLPEERRRIFLMICVDGMKYQEVADALQISKNTVKTQMARAVKFLREALKDYFCPSILFFLLKKEVPCHIKRG